MEHPTADAIIEVDNIVVCYGAFEALKNISLSIPHGATGLVGRNGAGKSTLLRLLLGLVRATKGKGRVLNVPLDAPGHILRRTVGYMPESDSLVPGLRGVEQVALAGELCGLGKSHALRRAHDLLAEVDLGEARYRPVEQYSTGMKQRLKLAVALVHDPQLLLLDEPTIGLDPPGRQRMLDLMIGLTTKHHKSLLICTHLLDDIQQTCQQVVMIEKGVILTNVPIDQVLEQDRHRYRVEWEGPGEPFIESVRKNSLHVRDDATRRVTEESFHSALVDLPAGFDTRDLFQLARDSGVRIRTLKKEREDIGDLYHHLVERDSSAEGAA